MSIGEVLKVFFYIVVLVVAFALLRALSDVEYSLRDKTITFEEVYKQEFDNSGAKIKALWSKVNKSESNPRDGVLYVKAGSSIEKKTYFDDFKAAAKDSGYINIIVIDHQIKPHISVHSQKGQVFQMNTDMTNGTRNLYKSQVIPMNDISRIEILSDGSQVQYGVESISIYKQNRPESLIK